MTLRTRRIFFWSLIPAFFIAGTGTVLYSQGYRFDTETHAVTKIGALYVRGYPSSARITLDGQPLDTGSWWPLQSGTLASNLVPGTYTLHAEAEGYQSWKADVVIRPSLVTERKALVLFPQTSTPVAIASSTTPTALFADDAIDQVMLAETLIAPRVIVGDESFPGTFVGSADGSIVTAVTTIQGKKETTALRFQMPGNTTAITSPYTGTVIDLMDDSVVVRESDTVISAYDIDTGTRSLLASSSDDLAITHVVRTRDYDAWVIPGATSSMLAVRNRGARTAQFYTFTHDILGLAPSGSSVGVHDAAGSLWVVDPSRSNPREVGHRASMPSWRPDGGAVAALIDDTLEVIPLKGEMSHGKLFGVVTDDDRITQIDWYPDGSHLFISTTRHLIFADIINGTAAEQHAYRMALPTSWAFAEDALTLYVLDGLGVRSYVFPD